jgi:CRISPR-associated endonuclease/helicase Cas3
MIDREEFLLAHDSNNKASELLSEHLERTLFFFDKLLEEKGVGAVLHDIIVHLKFKNQTVTSEAAACIKELFINAVYLHDIGKINPTFQYEKMKNTKVNFINSPDATNSRHSLLSALIYIDIYLKKIEEFKDKKLKRFLRHVLYSFSYIISRHHGYLKDLGEIEFVEDLRRIHEAVKQQPNYILYYKDSEHLIHQLNLGLFKKGKRYNVAHEPFEFYILNRLLYSAIVSCDFYATYLYDAESVPEFRYIDNIEEIFNVYKETKVYKGIEQYKRNKKYFENEPINALRSDMFIEAEKNLLSNLKQNQVFYLEAPTGSGKTNTSINLALNIINEIPQYNKIFYIFPFNTLVEQTKKTLDDIFNEDIQKDFRVVVVNSITPIITEAEEKESEDRNYKHDLLNRQMMHYPVVLTTHVNFFNHLFGVGREVNLSLIHFCNSVIILDEVQSYKNVLWPEIIKFLNVFSKLLNIKLIIMSATLPKLDELLKEDTQGFFELIKDKDKYYQNSLFKNRVQLNFELLSEGDITLERLFDKISEVISVHKQARILIEFIKKTTARKFYETLKTKFPNKKIYELTGDDSNLNRKKILSEINKKNTDGEFINNDIIVVATQVIEAGVDIDMDIGFKDISLLDSEEQFLGRINRSCKRKDCIAYFFNYDNAASIYKEDLRLEKDLREVLYQNYLSNKDFTGFYKLCFERLEAKKSQYNKENIKVLDEAVMYLNYRSINQLMKLIESDNSQLYLAYVIDDEHGNVIDGRKVWKEYKELIQNDEIDFAEKKVKLSILSEKMAYFTYTYYDNKNNHEPKFYDDNVGSLYYIHNGEQFITEDGKFDREKYNEFSGGLFL